MRPLNYLPGRELLLTTLTSISLYGTLAYAQQNDDNNEADNKDDNSAAAEPTNKDDKSADNKSAASSANNSADNKPTAATENTAAPPPLTTEKSDAAKPASTTEEKEPAPTTEEKDAPSSTEEKEDEATSTNDDEPSSTASVQSTLTTIPTRLSSAVPQTEALPTDMPTLTKLKPIPTYPAPSIPPTVNAPFMQHSSAPDGTVFIAVGAILGAFGLAILLWRLIVGILLHRSVEKAAKAQHDASTKTGFPAPPAPFYKYTDNASAMSLSTPGRGVRRTNRGPTPSSNPSQSNLFFSPTAAASGNGGGNRASTFLPSGFYAAGSGSPGAGHDHSISLTNLRPDSHYGNASRHTLNPSPPDSPSFHGRRDISNASLNLHRPPSQRAPSAFLDDLLADDPSILPPPNMPASRHSSYGNGSPGPQNRF